MTTAFVAAGKAAGVDLGPGVRRVHTPAGLGLLATRAGATVVVIFDGGVLQLRFLAGPTGGKAMVTIGHRHQVIDLYAPTSRQLVLSWSVGPGVHVLSIVALGKHRPGARGTRVVIEALRVLPAKATRAR